MERLTQDALLGASDLVEREIDLPAIGGSVKVRSLPAAFSTEAASEAITNKTVGRDQIQVLDGVKFETMKVFHALVDPKLESLEQARQFAENCGPSFKKVIEVIDEISDIDEEALEKAKARFQSQPASEVGGAGSDGAASGDTRPDVPARVGAGNGQER